MRTGSQGKPEPPAAPTIGNLAPTGFKVSWDEPGDNGSAITGYNYEILDVASNTVVRSQSLSGRSFSYYSLTPEKAYRVRVQAVNDNGDGPWSSYTAQTLPADRAASFSGSDTFTVPENTPITTTIGTVTASDPDLGAAVSGYTLTGGADQARFSLTSAGVLTFNSPPDFEAPADANADNDYLVAVTATSGRPDDANGLTQTATRTYTVTVTNVNEKPTAVDDTGAVTSGGTAFIPVGDLLANDTDPENDDLTVTAVGNAVNGTVSLSGTIISYTHSGTGATGSFDYTISDGALTDTGTVNVAVTTDTDYDADDDGLIEIGSLAQFNAIRWDLDGDASPATGNETAYDAVFPNAATGMGCPLVDHDDDSNTPDRLHCTGYELTADLDFDTGTPGDRTDDAHHNGGAGWLPIGDDGNRFTATFDGNGHAIANLRIDRTAGSRIGLFGVTAAGSEVSGVNLTGVSVTASSAVGGLVGVNHGTVSDSSAAGSVMASSIVGALVGTNHGTVSNGSAAGSVTGNGNNVGGLVGWNESGGRIASSHAAVVVSSPGRNNLGGLVGRNEGVVIRTYATGAVSGQNRLGGLVGWNNGGSINASYASGAVRIPTSAGNNAGGLVGENQGSITAAYATGAVRITGFSRNQGGLVGRHDGAASGVTVTASFATGRVSGGGGNLGDRGGLIGSNSAFNPQVTGGNVFHSYWDEESSGYV
ncbi:MAG: Ig-like domain-containing protein, partial [bacterium]|nr:Ig-like domain-containing protein [bacterium]